MQSTAESTPSMARYSWEYSGDRASNLDCSPSGTTHFSSSKMKWAMPMRTCSPSTELAMPWATRYSTLAWRSSWFRPRRRASSTTALAIEWGKCSSRQAARSPKRMDKNPWIRRAASRHSRPTIRKTGQARWVKRYSHQITRGWKAPITSSDAAPTTTPSKFSSTDITSWTSYHELSMNKS